MIGRKKYINWALFVLFYEFYTRLNAAYEDIVEFSGIYVLLSQWTMLYILN